jgi:plasmid stabilization system protein ParE
LRRGRNERIHCMDGAAARLAAGNQPSPLIGNRSVHPDDSPFESQRQLATQPLIEPLSSDAGGQALDAVPQLGEGHDAEEHLVLIDLGEPLDDASVWPRLGPLRDGVRVEQKAHKFDVRSGSLERRSFSPEPRNGEALKKSASDPLRWILRSHSPASTTTAVRRPLRVMVCGPCVRAFSMSSLNFALAWATVQMSVSMGFTSAIVKIVIIVIYRHWATEASVASRRGLTARAEADLREARTWSRVRWGAELTSRYFQDLHDGTEHTAGDHGSQRNRHDLAGGTSLRVYPIREHYIVYEPLTEGFIATVAVIRQGRDLPAILQKWAAPIRQEQLQIRRRIKGGEIRAPGWRVPVPRRKK